MKKKIFSLLVLLVAATGAWAQDADNCPNTGQQQSRVAKAPHRAIADILSDPVLSFECSGASQYGVATDGEYIYTSSWSTSTASMFYKYDLEGNFIEEFNITDCGRLRDLAYDGTYFYGVANGTTIYQVDFTNKTLVGTINTDMTMRCLTYDKKRDGFWVAGNWVGPLALYDRSGNKIQDGIYTNSVSGIGYYEDTTGEEHILQFDNNSNDVYDYNITTNTNMGSVFNLNSISGAIGSSGGCFIGEYKGQICMFGDVQQSPNLIGIYPIANAKGNGFDLTKADGAEAHGTIVFKVGDNEVDQAQEGDQVTMIVTPETGWAVNKPVGLWYAAENVVKAPRRAQTDIDMEQYFDLTFVSEDAATGAKTYTFTMIRANAEISCLYKKLLTNADITIADIADVTYVGAALEPAITVKDGETTLVLGKDYTVTYSNNINAGTATVTITAVATSEKYAGTTTKTFTILPKDLEDSMIAEISFEPWTGWEIKPEPAVTYNNMTLVKGTDFTYSYQNNIDIAEATAKKAPTVIVTGQGNYSGSASKTFTIGKAFCSVTFEVWEYEKNVGDPDFFVRAIVSGGGTSVLTYRSMDETIGTVDAQTGLVHLTGKAGLLVIYATLSGDPCYIDAIDYCRITVKDATGIRTIENGKSTSDNWFDLNGRRIEKPAAKGVYVKNGKKVVVK